MSFEKEKRAFSRSGGLLRAGAALRAGIHARTLYDMRDEGVGEELSRGLYPLADLPALCNPDLVSVAPKIPAGVAVDRVLLPNIASVARSPSDQLLILHHRPLRAA